MDLPLLRPLMYTAADAEPIRYATNHGPDFPFRLISVVRDLELSDWSHQEQ